MCHLPLNVKLCASLPARSLRRHRFQAYRKVGRLCVSEYYIGNKKVAVQKEEQCGACPSSSPYKFEFPMKCKKIFISDESCIVAKISDNLVGVRS